MTAAVALFLFVTSASTALAAPTNCTFDDTSGTVTLAVGDGLVATISRQDAAVTIDGIPCGSATVTNTDLIEVTTPAVSVEIVTVDLSGGLLAPGATDESDGSSEIELDIQLGGAAIGTFDEVHLLGTPSGDTMSADGFSANLNADEPAPDEDVIVSGDGELELLGAEGDDTLVLAGFGGEGLEIPKTARGGLGADRLVGDLNGSLLDGGSGRDTADYSSAGFPLNLVWDEAGSSIFQFNVGLDDLADVEVAVLSDDHDVAVYQGAAKGETLLGAGPDTAIVDEPVAGGLPTDRIVRGGPGSLDVLTLGSTPSDPITLELAPNTLGGSWTAIFAGFEYMEGGTGNDRFRITKRGIYPKLVGGDGHDVIDLRTASQGMSVTLGQRTFGERKWVTAFEVERVLGSNFRDVLIGPSGAADPKELIGSLGRDLLRGGPGSDLLGGGPGDDTLRGSDGGDTLRGWAGNDLLDGGRDPDTLSGGRGNDSLIGGPGVDDCDGGPGVNSFTGC